MPMTTRGDRGLDQRILMHAGSECADKAQYVRTEDVNQRPNQLPARATGIGAALSNQHAGEDVVRIGISVYRQRIRLLMRALQIV